MRIELISSAWKADNLPLIYTRIKTSNKLIFVYTDKPIQRGKKYEKNGSRTRDFWRDRPTL